MTRPDRTAVGALPFGAELQTGAAVRSRVADGCRSSEPSCRRVPQFGAELQTGAAVRSRVADGCRSSEPSCRRVPQFGAELQTNMLVKSSCAHRSDERG